MPSAANEVISPIESGVLFGIVNGDLAKSICRDIKAGNSSSPLSVAKNLPQFVDYLARSNQRVILLDDDLVSGAPLLEFLLQLTQNAPVVLIASFERQKEVAELVAEGKVEFVGRQGDFAPLAASLVLRHLRLAEETLPLTASPWLGMSEDVAEIFRHDINNPLTGILGNAELVLSHGTRLAPADIQRLQTVVDLSVRLRETIRRLSDAWEAQSQVPKSA